MDVNTALVIPEDDAQTLAIYATDQQLVELSEQAKAQTLAILDQKPDVSRIREARDKVKAIEAWLLPKMHSRELKMEARNNISESTIRLDREIGIFVAELEKNKGAQGAIQQHLSGDHHTGSPGDPPTYADMNLTPQQAARLQDIAALPADKLEEQIALARENGYELTTSAVQRHGQQYRRAAKNELLKAQPWPEGRYRIIYADPPWQYNDNGVITPDDSYGRAQRHYPTMSDEALCALPVKALADDNAVLFIWTTSPMLEHAFKVIKAWGFLYKTSFVWDKVRHNFGHYNSVRHEFLLVCTRGSCVPDSPKQYDSVLTIERSNVHSEKPVEFREIIDELYQYGRRIELFARESSGTWETWGNSNSTSTVS